MKTIKLILLLLIFTSCQKEDIKPDQPKTKVFTYEGRNIVDKIITLNGKEVIPPINVTKGDVVKVLFACQATTPKTYDLVISIFEDGVKVDGCTYCDKFEKTFYY